MEKTVIIMIGIAGIGKSTKMAELLKGTDHVILNADGVREELYGDPKIQGNPMEVFAVIRRRYLDALMSPKVTHIGLDNTSLSYKLRKQYYKLAKDLLEDEMIDDMPTFKLVYFEPDLEKALRQNAGRERNVPEDVIRRMANNIQPPNAWETANCQVVYA